MHQVIKLMVLVITLVLIMVISSFPFNKNSAEYEKAKAEISTYIERNYADVLILDDVSYNSKLDGYVGKVSEINDKRNKSFIAYFAISGDIADDYHYRTMTSMEDELRITIEALITSSGDISAESLQITPLNRNSAI